MDEIRSASALRGYGAAAVAAGAGLLGYLCTYSGDGLRISRVALHAAFVAEGFGDLVPLEESLVSSLNRASKRRLPDGFVTDAFKRPNADTPHAIGVYKIERREGEAGDPRTCGARVRVNKSSASFDVLPPDGLPADDGCMELARRIAGEALSLVNTAETTDVTEPLREVAAGPLHGFTLRPKSAVYFMRPSNGERWQALCRRLAPYGLVDLTFPVADAGPAVTSAAVAVQTGLEKKLAEIRDKVQTFCDKSRKSNITARVDECDTLAEECLLYADIMGDRADILRAEAKKIRRAAVSSLDGDFSFAGALAPEPPAPAPVAAPPPDDDEDDDSTGPTTDRGGVGESVAASGGGTFDFSL